jgi:hypothetical protein
MTASELEKLQKSIVDTQDALEYFEKTGKIEKAETERALLTSLLAKFQKAVGVETCKVGAGDEVMIGSQVYQARVLLAQSNVTVFERTVRKIRKEEDGSYTLIFRIRQEGGKHEVKRGGNQTATAWFASPEIAKEVALEEARERIEFLATTSIDLEKEEA